MKLSLHRLVVLGLMFSGFMGETALAAPARRASGKSLKSRQGLTPKSKVKAQRARTLTALKVRPDPVCYMETSRGLVDLSHLCQRQRSGQVVVINTRQVGDRLVGQVRNDTGATVRYALVNYTLAPANSGRSGQPGYTFVTPATLPPGAVGKFEETVKQTDQFRVTSVDWEGDFGNLSDAR
jgi:hypothetical protein